MVEKRTHKRFNKLLIAKLNLPQGEFYATVDNVARSGIALDLDGTPDIAPEMTIDIKLAPDLVVRTDAKAVWHKRISRGTDEAERIGVELDDPPSEYTDFVDELTYHWDMRHNPLADSFG